ncbi:MAG: ABC transporter permease subunit [Azospirillaceae bacterium]|nr:ABC transporter permease subunit [Azospirillaceae bacterium]
MTQVLQQDVLTEAGSSRSFLRTSRLSLLWRDGLLATTTWLAAAWSAVAWPDVVKWNDTTLWSWLMIGGAVIWAAFSVIMPWTIRFPRLRGTVGALRRNGPWLIALGVVFALWEVLTAKLGWLPKPFFSPPQGLLHTYVTDWNRLLFSILYSLRLWSVGFGLGIVVGFVIGVALGWSRRFNYWGMPLLKLIGPMPATAWLPFVFFIFPTNFSASAFLIALASGIPVAILTASGVATTNQAYYDVARTLGARDRFLVLKVAVPASLPHVFVGLFMGLYYSFAVLVVAEMLGAKFGLGWYLQFYTGYSAYANVDACLLVMALLCAGIVKLLFVVRSRVLAWQEQGLI